MAEITLHVLIYEEEDGSYWAKVQELPGCFASGFTLDELREALFEAIQLWLPDGFKLGEPQWSEPQEVPPNRRFDPRREGDKKERKGRRPSRRMKVCV